MTTKQLIELLSRFDPETTVQVAFPSTDNYGNLYRDTLSDIHVEELARYNGVHPLISVGGAHLLED
jgi:hypothetical protein